MQFAYLRGECNHENLLVATGGKNRTGPTYSWMCQGCGSRWERVAETELSNPSTATQAQTRSQTRIEPQVVSPQPSKAPASARWTEQRVRFEGPAEDQRADHRARTTEEEETPLLPKDHPMRQA